MAREYGSHKGACDFYVGLGTDAEWIGTVAEGGDPCELEPRGFFGGVDDHRPFDEADFREAVANLLADYTAAEVAFSPEAGWPWKDDDSTTTDYAVCFQPGARTVTVYQRGYQIAIHYPNGGRSQQKFPNMEAA